MENIKDGKLSAMQFRVTQVKSSIGRKYDQKQTLLGLGLGRLHKSVILEGTSSIRGMVDKVQHLLKIENIR